MSEEQSTSPTPNPAVSVENPSSAPQSPVAEKADEETPSDPATPERKGIRKVEILLKPAGDAPMLKQRKFLIDDSKDVRWILVFIRKYLKMTPDESLFVYVNQAFAPAPDSVLRNLYDCFGSESRLVLHYSKTQAWG